MHTIDYLFGPNAAVFWPPVLVGLLVATLCAALSPLVVLRRMSFIGQGVSHAAFGGVGIALALGLGARGPGDWTILAVVAIACACAALGIAALTDRRGVSADTAIGIVLVAAMALGFILIQHAAQAARTSGSRPPIGVESVLFGSMLGVNTADVALAAIIAVIVTFTLWWRRRSMLFWAFDEVGAISCGVSAALERTALLLLLALAIVITMRLAGVVLATALLVLPGATALACSTRYSRVVAISLAAGIAGVVAGIVLSFELDWPSGPSIVVAEVALYALARGARSMLPAPGA
ncbi:MAG: metal ABC transporter permease [Phycisphaerales bacterium]|nr:metal ABC transporter permease [Phycisphaerales bacterium]